jgi:hypothetical protein
MKKFKQFLEDYDVYLDDVYTQKGLSGGKPNADELDDIITVRDPEGRTIE